MKQTEERSLYNLILEDDKLCLVSLTTSQVDLIKWLRNEGYNLVLEKMNNNNPIII